MHVEDTVIIIIEIRVQCDERLVSYARRLRRLLGGWCRLQIAL
jgi:hypothetical protein